MGSDKCQFELPRQCQLSHGHDGPHVTYPDQQIMVLREELAEERKAYLKVIGERTTLEAKLAEARREALLDFAQDLRDHGYDHQANMAEVYARRAKEEK